MLFCLSPIVECFSYLKYCLLQLIQETKIDLWFTLCKKWNWSLAHRHKLRKLVSESKFLVVHLQLFSFFFPISVLLVLTSSVSAGNTKDAFGCTQTQLSLMMCISGKMEIRHHIGWGCFQIGSMWTLHMQPKK